MADDQKGSNGPPRAGIKETFPDLDEAMKKKHSRPHEKGKTLSDVPVSEFFDDDDDFTPIHTILDLSESLSTIKRGNAAMAVTLGHVERNLGEQDRKLDEMSLEVTRDTANLQARQKTSEARLKTLETETKMLASPQPHDCYQGDTIEAVRDEGRQGRVEIQAISSRLAVTETKIQTNEKAIEEDGKKTDKSWGRVWAIGGTLVFFVLAAVGGWIATLYTLRADVQHLSGEQTKLRATVESAKRSTNESVSKMTTASTKMTAAAVKMTKAEVDAGPPQDPLEFLWCDISEQEKRRQARIRGRDKIPTKRCPR